MAEHDDFDEPRPSAWRTAWRDNKGALMILVSELFGSSMDAIARYLQQSGRGYPTLQIIVARMGITFVLSSLYMWWTQVPHFPLGHPDVRGWLVLRAVCGFAGLFSLYYSVHYLPLAESTVIRFLIPLATAWSCSVFLGQPFTRPQLIAGLVALLGVVCIARPAAIFGHDDDADADEPPAAGSGDGALDAVAPAQRMLAMAVCLLGVVGATGAYTVIRVIGDRAHPLMSVNYFALVATAGAGAALAAAQGFVAPRGARDWLLLAALGVLGFALQFLLTAGLQLDRSPRATSLLYTQVVFALAFDWAVWGVLPAAWSLVGGAVVVASTLWSALHKTTTSSSPSGRGRGAAKDAVADEETALLSGARRQGEGAAEEART